MLDPRRLHDHEAVIDLKSKFPGPSDQRRGSDSEVPFTCSFMIGRQGQS